MAATMKDILARTRKRAPYGVVVATFFEQGTLKATAEKLGYTQVETWRQVLRGLTAFVEECRRSLNVS